MDFVTSHWDKVIVLNHEDLNFCSAERELLLSFRNTCSKKSDQLNKLLHIYASGYQENFLQRSFYNSLIYSIDQFLDGTHPAYKNKEGFLGKTNIVRILPLPENVIESTELDKVTKLKILKSPESVMAGFQQLIDRDYCIISDLQSFVFHRFQFKSSYNIPEIKLFYFRWDASQHLLSELFGELRKNRTVTSTEEELIDWVISLIKSKSRESVRKYSSGHKKNSKRNYIGVEIFS